MGNGAGTARPGGAGALAARPKLNKIAEKTPRRIVPSTATSSANAPQKEHETVVKAIPAKPPSSKEQTSAAGTQPWGELHSMNDQLDSLYLSSSRVVIGRHRDCTLCVQGPLFSGKHCTITRQIYEGGGQKNECYFLLDTRLMLDPGKFSLCIEIELVAIANPLFGIVRITYPWISSTYLLL